MPSCRVELYGVITGCHGRDVKGRSIAGVYDVADCIQVEVNVIGLRDPIRVTNGIGNIPGEQYSGNYKRSVGPGLPRAKPGTTYSLFLRSVGGILKSQTSGGERNTSCQQSEKKREPKRHPKGPDNTKPWG